MDIRKKKRERNDTSKSLILRKYNIKDREIERIVSRMFQPGTPENGDIFGEG